MSIVHLYVFFGEKSIQVLFPFSIGLFVCFDVYKVITKVLFLRKWGFFKEVSHFFLVQPLVLFQIKHRQGSMA